MKLQILKRKGKTAFTTAEASKLGISPQLLHHYVNRGLIEKSSHGVYRLADAASFGDFQQLLLEALKAIPQGIIGMKTALRLHGLTEELPETIDILVPRNNIPKRKLEDISIHPCPTDLYKEDAIKIGKIPVTSLERTLIDLLRAGEPLSAVLNAYREARAKKKTVSLPKLKKLSVLLRAKAKTAAFLEAIL